MAGRMQRTGADLVEHWRTHAALLRRYGAEAQAAVLEQCAAEVEAEILRNEQRRVSLDEAVDITGFTRGHLRRLLKANPPKLNNVGTDEEPEFIAAELPRKAGYSIANRKLAEDAENAVNYAWQAARAAVFGE